MNTSFSIKTNEANMEQLTADYNKCADYVKDMIEESVRMRQIIYDSYKGSASAGLDDFYSVLNQHLELLMQCYRQLACFTTMVKEITFENDEIMSKSINSANPQWKVIK